MKTIKNLLKGILVWLTIATLVLTFCCIEGLTEKGIIYFIGMVACDALLLSACALFLKENDFYRLSGCAWIDKLMGYNKE